MNTVRFHAAWRLRFEDPRSRQIHVIPAQVPGNVLGDLVRAQLAPDPYYGANSLEYRVFEYTDWTYECEFTVPECAPGEKLELVFEGVDTVAEYRIDDQRLGESCNMFIEQRFDLTGRFVRRRRRN